jgi:ATP synthase protein I
VNSDLNDLGKKLDEIRGVKQADKRLSDEQLKNAENMSNGMRAGAELVGAIIAGGFIGWLLDGWLGTKPLMLIIFLLLGIFTGFYNVWRTTQNIGSAVGFSELHKAKKDAKTSADEKTRN